MSQSSQVVIKFCSEKVSTQERVYSTQDGRVGKVRIVVCVRESLVGRILFIFGEVSFLFWSLQETEVYWEVDCGV